MRLVLGLLLGFTLVSRVADASNAGEGRERVDELDVGEDEESVQPREPPQYDFQRFPFRKKSKWVSHLLQEQNVGCGGGSQRNV